MQALVSVRFRNGYPVFHTVRVRLVHVGDDRIDLPAFRTLLFQRRIQYDTDGEQIVYAFKLDLLLFQLIINGMDRLGTSFNVEMQSGFFQFLLDRCDESGNIKVARTFSLVQLPFDEIVLFAVGIFQRQIFQFAFDLIQSEPVCERCIQIRGFRCQPQPVVFLQLFTETHQAEAVGDHDEDNPHVFRK